VVAGAAPSRLVARDTPFEAKYFGLREANVKNLRAAASTDRLVTEGWTSAPVGGIIPTG
jgi:hypothetical protein